MKYRTLIPIALLMMLPAGSTLATGKPADQGTLVVRVLSRADGLPIAKASVEAIDPASLEPDHRTGRRKIETLASGTTDGKGWVRLEGIRAGDVILKIRPKSRAIPWSSDPIKVRAGIEDVLDDIEVPPPSSLMIHLDLSPSVRQRLEQGVVEAVVVYGSTDRAGDDGFHKETTKSELEIHDVNPGKWKLRALLKFHHDMTIVDPKGVEVLVPEGVPIDVTLPVPSLVFSGRVTLRGKPVKGQMNPFPSDRKKKGAFGFAVPLDENGEFAFPLPEPGLFDLRVFGRDPKESFFIQLPKVRFSAADAESPMKIELPEGAIEGVVVDGTGNPVSGARVTGILSTKGASRTQSNAKSGDEGRFRLEPLVGGEWKLEASTLDASSKSVLVDLGEDATRDGVVLALTRRRVKVSVLDATGAGSPRVLVTATVHRPDGSVSRASGGTDPHGVVGLDLDATSGDLVAMTVMDVRSGTCTPALIPFSDAMQVRLAAQTGVITFSRSDEPRYLVDASGAFLDLRKITVVEWSGQNSERVTIPAGTWLLIDHASPAQVEQLYRGLGTSIPGAARIVVPAGGTVAIPSEKR